MCEINYTSIWYVSIHDFVIEKIAKFEVCMYSFLFRFLGNLLKLLICSNEKFGHQIQKHVKELVGHELNPAIYPILFDQIKLGVDKFFDSSGQVTVIKDWLYFNSFW